MILSPTYFILFFPARSIAQSQSYTQGGLTQGGQTARTTFQRTGKRVKRACRLINLNVGDNQLGWLSGYGLAAFVKNNSR